MAYNTILVHCADKRRVARLVSAAVEVAEKFQAHLIGLSVSPQVRVLPAGVPGTPDTLVIDERAQAYRRHNPEMKAAFEAAVQGRSLTAEWCEQDCRQRSGCRRSRQLRQRRGPRHCRAAGSALVGVRVGPISEIGWPWKAGVRC